MSTDRARSRGRSLAAGGGAVSRDPGWIGAGSDAPSREREPDRRAGAARRCRTGPDRILRADDCHRRRAVHESAVMDQHCTRRWPVPSIGPAPRRSSFRRASTPLPFATTFTVRVDARRRARRVARSGQPYEFTFATPAVRLLEAESYRKERPLRQPAILVLRFNQPVRAADVLAHARVARRRTSGTARSCRPRHASVCSRRIRRASRDSTPRSLAVRARNVGIGLGGRPTCRVLEREAIPARHPIASCSRRRSRRRRIPG